MRKGLPENTWKWVAQEIRKLNQLGGRYEVILSGIQLSSSKVDKAILTHCFESTLDRLQRCMLKFLASELVSQRSSQAYHGL